MFLHIAFFKNSTIHITPIYILLITLYSIFIFSNPVINIDIQYALIKINDYFIINTNCLWYQNQATYSNVLLFLSNLLNCSSIFESTYKHIFEKNMFAYLFLQIESYNYNVQLLYQPDMLNIWLVGTIYLCILLYGFSKRLILI